VYTEPLPSNGKGYTDRPTDSPLIKKKDRVENDASNNSSTLACIRCRLNMFTQLMPSNGMGNIDIQTDGRDL
jgi:hypothetical protein